MEYRRLVEVDGRGNVVDSRSGRWLGRTETARPPRSEADDESEPVRVRDTELELVGWIEASEAGLHFVRRAERRGEELNDLEEFADRYASDRDPRDLESAMAAAAELLNDVSTMSIAHADQLVGALERLHAVVQTVAESTAAAEDGALARGAGAGDENGVESGGELGPIVLVGGGATVLFSDGTQAGQKIGEKVLDPVKELQKTGQLIKVGRYWFLRLGDQLILLGRRLPGAIAAALGAILTGGKQALVVVGGILGSPFVVGPLAGIATLLWQAWVIEHMARIARRAIAKIVSRLLEELEEIIKEGFLEKTAHEIVKRLRRLPIDIDDDCVELCLIQWGLNTSTAVENARDLADQWVPIGAELKEVLNERLDELEDCLEDCGVTGEALWLIVAGIRRSMNLGAIGGIIWKLLGRDPGDATALFPTAPVPPEARDLLRKGAETGLLPGQHRRGGFAFEEFEDDTDENPDIANEDPAGAVTAPEVVPDDATPLLDFDCSQLDMRRKWLAPRLDEILVNYRALLKEIRDDLGSSGDPVVRDGLLTLNTAYMARRREVRELANALQRTVDAMIERPCPELSVAEFHDHTVDVAAAKREVSDGPVFRDTGDAIVEVGPGD